MLSVMGCDSSSTPEVTLNLVGSVRDTAGVPVTDANLLLGGVFIDDENLIIPLKSTTSDDAGNYSLTYTLTLASLREGSNGECIAMAESGEVRIAMTGGDSEGLYGEAYPSCADGEQRVDLDLAPIGRRSR
jgi:hypothetical protein